MRARHGNLRKLKGSAGKRVLSTLFLKKCGSTNAWRILEKIAKLSTLDKSSNFMCASGGFGIELGKMASNTEEWSDWNPMAQDFSNEYTNEDGQKLIDEAPAPVADNSVSSIKDAIEAERAARSARQQKYPYLVVKKTTSHVTEPMLITFFGNDLIQHLEYRQHSRVFFVYFKNIGSLETAQSQVDRFPSFIDCHRGRHRPQQEDVIESNEPVIEPAADPGPTPSITERTAVNLSSRTITVSAGCQKLPIFVRPPLLATTDYTAKGSLLAINDPDRRYLYVKYEFALERHGLYMVQEERMEHKCTVHYLSGRTRAIPYPIEEELTKDEDISFGYLIDKMGLRKCVVCQKWTDVACKICSMAFCHEECFEEVAQEHKESCGTGKELELGDRVGRRKWPEPGLPPFGSKVKITAFQQTDVVYVRSAELKDQVAYTTVLSEVMMQGKAAARLDNLPRCGQMVLYKFETEIIRALVLCVDDLLNIYVVCIDFGNVEITRLEDLYECSAYLARLPCYPIAVKLRGIPAGFMSPNVREMMYELGETMVYKLHYSQQEYDHKKNIQQVVLSEVHRNGSLNRLLRTIMYPTVPSVSELGYQEGYLPHLSLPTGKSIDLVVMDNSLLKCGLVYCTLKDLAYEVTKIQRDLQIYGQSKSKCSFYAPPKNDLCVAKYEGKWCRGLSMELVGDGYPSILFIDYGNIVPIHVSDIRPYPPQFTFPVLTTELDLIGCPAQPTDEQVKRLEQRLAVGSTVTCSEIVRCQETNNYSARFDDLQMVLGLD